ncbi:MAG: response regulator [Alphaproteobacteria bacterium]|nr:response regulator [Alphaproteobacteria bacterium]
MKALIIDRDEIVAQMIKARLEPVGHKVFEEQVKNNAVERLAKEQFDVIFLDPAPLMNARPLVLNIRRASGAYPYVVLTGGDVGLQGAIKSGANDFLAKPVDPEKLDKIVGNARDLTALIRRIGDDSEDFPSAGGIIAKSAFNQLFLSAIDRADRYGEQTYIVFIRVSNYQDIYEKEGPYAADYAVAKLSQFLVRLRRQSDIIAQTDNCEYALLLQRPLYETEPFDAANRFAEAIAGFEEFFHVGAVAPEVCVKLVDLPIGSTILKHDLKKQE